MSEQSGLTEDDVRDFFAELSLGGLSMPKDLERAANKHGPEAVVRVWLRKLRAAGVRDGDELRAILTEWEGRGAGAWWPSAADLLGARRDRIADTWGQAWAWVRAATRYHREPSSHRDLLLPPRVGLCVWVGVQQVGGWAAVRRVEDGDPAARAAFRDGYQGHARRSLRIFDELPALYTLPQPHRGPVERRIRDRTGEVRRVLCHGSDGGPGGLARAVREGRPMLEGPTEEQAGQVLRLLPGGRDL